MAKPIVYTRHAKDALTERELDREWVEAAVRTPDWRLPDPSTPEVERRYKTIPAYGNRVLRVACLETPDEIRILTAFFDRKAKLPK